jgi:hypothetical protein
MKQEDNPTGINLIVSGIVAARNGMPYVVLEDAQRRIAQLTIAEARSIALDLMRSASYAETDAMLIGFFKRMELPENALGMLLIEFRDFRHQLDVERVEGFSEDPDSGDAKRRG